MTSQTYDPLRGRTFWNERIRVTPTYTTTYFGTRMPTGTEETRELTRVERVEDADFVSSRMAGEDEDVHAPALDLDFRAAIRERPDGRRCLFLDRMASITEVRYCIDHLGSCGIISATSWSAMAAGIRLRAMGQLADLTIRFPPIPLLCDAALIPSSTPGHYHLYLDRGLTWEAYRDLLHVLTQANIIERNFLAMADRNRMSLLLKPGLRKASFPERIVEEPNESAQTYVRPIARDDLGS